MPGRRVLCLVPRRYGSCPSLLPRPGGVVQQHRNGEGTARWETVARYRKVLCGIPKCKPLGWEKHYLSCKHVTFAWVMACWATAFSCSNATHNFVCSRKHWERTTRSYCTPIRLYIDTSTLLLSSLAMRMLLLCSMSCPKSAVGLIYTVLYNVYIYRKKRSLHTKLFGVH